MSRETYSEYNLMSIIMEDMRRYSNSGGAERFKIKVEFEGTTVSIKTSDPRWAEEFRNPLSFEPTILPKKEWESTVFGYKGNDMLHSLWLTEDDIDTIKDEAYRNYVTTVERNIETAGLLISELVKAGALVDNGDGSYSSDE